MSSVPYVPPDTMKKVAATNGQSVRWADFLLELLAVGLGDCAAVLSVDNSYGFLLNGLDSVAAFNVRKIVRDARIKLKTISTEATEERHRERDAGGTAGMITLKTCSENQRAAKHSPVCFSFCVTLCPLW